MGVRLGKEFISCLKNLRPLLFSEILIAVVLFEVVSWRKI